MGILLQVPSSPPSINGNTIILGMVGFIVVFCLVTYILKEKEYSAARTAFLENPENGEARQRLIRAGRGRSHDNSTSEILSLFQVAEDDAKKQDARDDAPAPDLQTLTDLREQGMLSDDAFEKAKARRAE